MKEGREKGMKEGREKGMKEGREKGMKEGIKEGKLEAAQKMKSLGISPDLISQATGLGVEDIAKL